MLRSLGSTFLAIVVVTCCACSASESNEIDNSSDNLDLAPGSSIEITACEKDDLDRPVAEVSITSSSEGGGPFFVWVRFESTDGNTDYGDATEDGGLGEVGGPQTESTVRVTGSISAPTAVRCSLRNGSVNVTGGGGEPAGDTAATPSDRVTATPAGDGGVPALVGPSLQGDELTIPSEGTKIMVFVAHWCPHCQALLPELVNWIDSGAVPTGVDVYGVSTAIDSNAPNYPPDQWFTNEGWTQPTLIDAADVAADAYGVDGLPYLVFVNADGSVATTFSGETPVAELQSAADALTT